MAPASTTDEVLGGFGPGAGPTAADANAIGSRAVAGVATVGASSRDMVRQARRPDGGHVDP